VIAYAPMKSGLLTGKMTRERLAALDPEDFRRRNPFFQEPILTKALGLVELLREIGAAHGRSPGETAIAWVLRHPAVTGAIVGVRSPEQLRGVIGAAGYRLAEGEIERIGQYLASA